jgi:hypothetical protein
MDSRRKNSSTACARRLQWLIMKPYRQRAVRRRGCRLGQRFRAQPPTIKRKCPPIEIGGSRDADDHDAKAAARAPSDQTLGVSLGLALHGVTLGTLASADLRANRIPWEMPLRSTAGRGPTYRARRGQRQYVIIVAVGSAILDTRAATLSSLLHCRAQSLERDASMEIASAAQ